MGLDIQYILTKSFRSTSSNIVIEKINLRNIADLSIDKVRCCYFDEGNLEVVDFVKAGGIHFVKAGEVMLYIPLVFRSKRVDRGVFTVHEEYMGAVALTGCAREDHAHQLASYVRMRSSTDLRLLSGDSLCFVLSGLCRRYLRWWSSLSLFNP